MPAHATVHARTVGVPAEVPPAAPVATQHRAANPRATTLEGERKVLHYVNEAAGAADYLCLTLSELGTKVDMTKETLRLRVDALREDGRLRREPCWCATFDVPHVRFYKPDASVVEAAAATARAALANAEAAKAPRAAGSSAAAETDGRRSQTPPGPESQINSALIATPAGFAPGRARKVLLSGQTAATSAPAAVPAVAKPAAAIAVAAPVVVAAAKAAPEPVAVVTAKASPIVVSAALGFSQVFAAQPDSFALYRVGGAVWRDPIVAWGVWAENEGAQAKNVAGPLVFGSHGLVAASSLPGFVGVRMGAYRVLDGERSFDANSQAIEPA